MKCYTTTRDITFRVAVKISYFSSKITFLLIADFVIDSV